MKKILKFIFTIIVVALIVLVVGFISKKIKIAKRNYKLEQIDEYKYFVVRENEKYGIIDASGNKVIDTKYDNVRIPNPEKDVFICYEGEKSIVINSQNQQLYSEYQNIEPLILKNIASDLIYEKNTLTYKENEKYGIIDLKGKKITKAIYEEIDTLEYKEGELIVKKDGKYGVINIKGSILVKPEYDQIVADRYYDNEEGFKKAGYIVSVTTDQGYRYGYVSVNGKKIVDAKYNDLYRITEIDSEDNIYLICAENGKYGVLKNSKVLISNDYQSVAYSQNKVFIISKGIRYGVMDLEGKEIVPVEFRQIDINGQYIYATDSEDITKVFNNNGQEMNVSRNLSIIDVEGTDYKINIETTDGDTKYSVYRGKDRLTNDDYRYIEYLYDNYFIASDMESNLGIINDNNKEILQFNYNSIQKIENTDMIQATDNDFLTEIYTKDFKRICDMQNAEIVNKGNYLRASNQEDVKYITMNGKEVKNTEIFKDNTIFANKFNDRWGFVDKKGNKVVDYDYEKVTEQNKYGFAGIKKDGKWGIVDEQGKIIVEPQYEINTEEPLFIGEYYQVIYGNGEMYYTNNIND